MGKKNRIEQVIEKVENLITIPEVPAGIAEEDFQELAGTDEETDESRELGELSDSFDAEEDTEFSQKAPEGKSLSALNKEIKEKMKAEGKSTRVMTSDARKTYATSRLAASLEKRGWIKGETGVYTLASHKLDIKPDTFEAKVDGYTLPLGGGALKILDQYVALSKAAADQDMTPLSS